MSWQDREFLKVILTNFSNLGFSSLITSAGEIPRGRRNQLLKELIKLKRDKEVPKDRLNKLIEIFSEKGS
ncbi:MAG: hypothetical protein CL674_02900 [Bdellovibrionaceae bacterium]|nr:hypothetical protein [Pseudobdellovibrionaceae bacterium]|tara:strand:- start:8299 stop:8508 length:210 start_codon:yes stop_codon:yes gene_type:complete